MILAALAFPGSLVDPGSEAHESLTRVRLLHAALRHWLPRSGRLDNHKDCVPEGMYVEGELPLNQHDLALTLGIFCYLNLRSLRRMGVVLSTVDIQSYAMMWRYCGHVLGIVPELCPSSLEEQEEFMMASMKHQGDPDSIHGLERFVRPFGQDMDRASRGWLGADRATDFLLQMVVHLNGRDYVPGLSDGIGGHWAPRLVHAVGYLVGTVLPRLPGGESFLFTLHTSRIRRMLDRRRRREAMGHGAGSGAEPIETVRARL